MSTIFEKIINREIPADIIYENNLVICFRDIQPVAPKHYLLIPKEPVKNILELNTNNTELLQALLTGIKDITAQENMSTEGFRVITNTGEYAGQTVFHLHFHIIGGKELSWDKL